jgi:hypothetical protein
MSEIKDIPEWPVRLKLRDTKVIADEGQRIYSTATGYGYEKCGYVRADIADDLLQMLKVAQLWLDIDGRYDMQGINLAIAKAEEKK